MISFLGIVGIFVCLFHLISGIPDQGTWTFELNKEKPTVTVVKSLFKGSQISIQVNCEQDGNHSDTSNITVQWSLRDSECWQDYVKWSKETKSISYINITKHIHESKFKTFHCYDPIHLPPYTESEVVAKEDSDGGKEPHETTSPMESCSLNQKTNGVYCTKSDGFYLLIVDVKGEGDHDFRARVEIWMKGSSGYLSAADWPLLPFYGSMCLVYLVMGLAWLIVSFLQWRDLLRIQFWIGGVILLGMLEMATFYAEYSSYNSTGNSFESTLILAELVSCGKRTLARMLVIVVSLGFGIVKPRLGSLLHRVVLVGILYFVLASIEAYMRLERPKTGAANQLLVASVPLALLDSAICWWIFTSLVQTTRTLRLRRNLVKLALYRHFTNTLAFAVVASVLFMVYSIKAHHLTVCFTDWKELWVDEAYWKLLFSVILLVIMILWRPTNNNQRYAFSPLIDAADDDDDEEEQFVNDAYGVKMRGGQGSGSPKQRNNSNSAEEDLKWVEEHIPTSLADTALPILDSDEEIMTTKFELSKMQ